MYTTNENGILNNYAAEPKVYFAEYPSAEQQQRYTVQAAIAAGLVVLSLLTAFVVS
ncbi:photosystem II assembly protein Psb34 [Stenomitos frigidus]|uniref:Ssl1498 family light-harvesting-like protein n=1 Tax=Stenomitos frigidus ULC18 TaxID=2107698 RepID=A0A2T1DSW4_9CYAN|nr:ssl1498 family light-harvesting-like protein [Stenomitos frigidus]PSB23606.1 hypothetical protein C7B82_30465 [Stenomitos frigidus ULC18]